MSKVVVITGSSSGIGKNLKKMFEENGDIVIGLSRSESQSPTSFPCDLTDAEQIKTAFDFIGEKYGHVDILVNNAGFGISGATELVSENQIKNIFDVNFFGALTCARLCLPLMDKNSKIINISSACALFPLPFRTLYCSSKSALNMLSQSWDLELRPFGIRVVSICPGDIKTNFTKNREKSFETNKRYDNRIKNATSYVDNRENKRMSIDAAVTKIFKICNKRNPKPMYIIGAKYKLFYFGQKILPIRIFNGLIGKIFDGKKKK